MDHLHDQSGIPLGIFTTALKENQEFKSHLQLLHFESFDCWFGFVFHWGVTFLTTRVIIRSEPKKEKRHSNNISFRQRPT
jgi:hypothetical protein